MAKTRSKSSSQRQSGPTPSSADVPPQRLAAEIVEMFRIGKFDKSRFSAAAKKLREMLRLTQTEMADGLGVSLPTVVRWERGHSLPTPSLQLRERFEGLRKDLDARGGAASFSGVAKPTRPRVRLWNLHDILAAERQASDVYLLKGERRFVSGQDPPVARSMIETIEQEVRFHFLFPKYESKRYLAPEAQPVSFSFSPALQSFDEFLRFCKNNTLEAKIDDRVFWAAIDDPVTLFRLGFSPHQTGTIAIRYRPNAAQDARRYVSLFIEIDAAVANGPTSTADELTESVWVPYPSVMAMTFVEQIEAVLRSGNLEKKASEFTQEIHPNAIDSSDS